MRITENTRYLHILERLLRTFPLWDALNGKQLLISGASGMLGSLLTDALMLRNEALPPEAQCRVIALGRNHAAAKDRFARWAGRSALTVLPHDISTPLNPLPAPPDYWIHGASTTHPLAYSSQPVNTVLANVLGTRNLLDLAVQSGKGRFLLLSSVEVYGENRGDTELFTEDYCGYLDCNTLRAGYPEAKRVSEALCQAYIRQNGADAVIIRLPRCYGPTMRMEDSKALAQFIKKSARGENIVLKSTGEQKYSFAHAADAVLGVLWVLLAGETGNAYNLGDSRSDATLREVAEIAADHAKTRVLFELPMEAERQGYSTATKALLDGAKLRKLGWALQYELAPGIRETIEILRELEQP